MITRPANPFGAADGGRDLILESLSEGVCIVGPDRTIGYANRAASTLLGYGAGELEGRHYAGIFSPQTESGELRDPDSCPVLFAFSEGTVTHISEELFVRADGAGFLVEVVCSPILDGKDCVGAVLTFQDITERREIETAVREARDAALEAARTKAAFLANISHEIRTPLSGIVGTANLLADTDLSEEQRACVEMLNRSVSSLMETVNDILDFSKIEAGKLRLETIEFALGELVDETVSLYRPSAQRKGISIVAELPESGDGRFRGDGGRLRQILNNLVGNAVKFTPAGSVRIRVSAGSSDAGDSLLFEVIDTGIGIGAEQRARLFQPFTQADVSTTRRFGGTGLGLAICRELVGLMNGRIGVESEPGEGSRFWFEVPIRRVETAWLADPAGEIPEAFGRLVGDPLPGLRLLVVEDNEIGLDIAVRILGQLGYSAETARNGLEAVAAAARRRYDVILMDCQMPEMDGCTAAAMIREGGLSSGARIIALSANAEELERENCLRAGMDDFLSKPPTKQSLAAMLARHGGSGTADAGLDLMPQLPHHSLSKIVTPEILDGFVEIESRGETGFVADIYRIYFENALTEVAEMKRACESGGVSEIGRIAHRLRGSSANVGLAGLVSRFADLENKCGSGQPAPLRPLIEEIEDRLAGTRQEIFDLLYL